MCDVMRFAGNGHGRYVNGYGNNYFVSNLRYTWHQARGYCRRLWRGQGRLVTIDHYRENQWLASQVRGKNTWIGANDIRREGHWRWDNGCPVRYRRWNPREPNNWRNEDCAHFVTRPLGRWNDIRCNHRFNFICERRRNRCGR